MMRALALALVALPSETGALLGLAASVAGLLTLYLEDTP